MKAFFAKLTAFAVLLAGLQYVAGWIQQDQMIATDFFQMDAMRPLYGKEADIIYLCDSVNFFVSPNDGNPDAISAFLQQDLGGRKVHALAGGAFQMNLYREMVETLLAKGTRPRMVIIAVSIRTFGIRWDLNPSWQFVKPLVILKSERNPLYRSIAKPLMVFKAIDLIPVSSQDLLNAPLFVGTRNEGTLAEIQKRYLDSGNPRTVEEWHIKLGYLFSLDANHRHADSMRQLVRLLKKADVPFFFYVVPVDWEAGVATLGRPFSDGLESNVATVTKILEEEHAPIHDLSRAIPSEYFYYPEHFMDEHLNEGGRRRMAKLLAERVKIHEAQPGGPAR